MYDRIVLVFFVACGVSPAGALQRDGRADVRATTARWRTSRGHAIPTSMLLVAVLWVAAAQGAVGDALWGGVWWVAGFKLHPLVLVFALSGSLMVSRIRIPKL
jgi:CDP-diacylglycerol--serine O-phosphatidyltransferase